MVAVALTWVEYTAVDLRWLAAACRNAAAARRMLALALVLEGSPRAVAAETCGMDRQTLRDWVHRYNAEGLAGMSNRHKGLGRKPLLTPEQTAVVAELERTAPDLATHGVVRWRRADLAAVIERRFSLQRCRRAPSPRRRSLCRRVPQPRQANRQRARQHSGTAICNASPSTDERPGRRRPTTPPTPALMPPLAGSHR
ncbi:helix-turn-helix domain-containing protein [Dankookia rubra]|uniref:Helix-turn-helix domain-containing protein n=1 Tax=Dankookia rubra TaxID=1442381 RepID=A0A4R5QBM3_9PROT|nr:helix-turn-helix domain-containing protein [Dankookia rubra]